MTLVRPDEDAFSRSYEDSLVVEVDSEGASQQATYLISATAAI